MQNLVLGISDDSWNALQRNLSVEEFSNLGRYLAGLIEKDLFERKSVLLAHRVRQELARAGAERVFSVDIEEFARNPREIAEYITRTGEPVSVLVNGRPALLVQAVRNVVRTAWEVFGKAKA